jgi:hypothetical protein
MRDATEMEKVGDRIAEQAAHLDAAHHRLLADIRIFDAAGEWGRQGAKSCAHWLTWKVGWTEGVAREHVRVARRLGELPLVDDGLRRGELSYAKVRAITRVATAATEPLLVEMARHSTGAQLEEICRKYRTTQAAVEPDVERDLRQVNRRVRDDGLVEIKAVLRADEAALVWAAIAHASAETHDRVAGLLALARGERPPVEVVVTVTRETLAGTSTEPAVLDDGTAVSPATAQRLACDAGVVEIVEDATGQPLSVGRKRRTVSAALARALRRRDPTCRFPGCTGRAFLDVHHVVHWARGGETSLANTILLCTYHHAYVHEHGCHIIDGAFFDPTGRKIEAVSRRSAPPDLGWTAIRRAHADLEICERTGRCDWDGGPVDYGAAVDVLVRA